MRLLHCHLKNVRLHGDLAVTFAPGLTLIGGANETGKSTLVEALHRALFLRASASGAPVEALRSRLHPGQPTVELGFEAQGESWALLKRFSGSSGTVSLTVAGGERLTGAAAEERLATLLGVRETLGSKQAGNLLPSRWAHLWVLQGRSGENLLARGGSSYDLEALVTQLERGGGTALQSALDQAVAGRIEAALGENFTAGRGSVKRNAPLWQAQQALTAADAGLDEALARLAAFEAASDELGELTLRLEQLQGQALPELVGRRADLSWRAAEASRLTAAIALRQREIEPQQLQLRSLASDLRELAELDAAIAGRQQELERLAIARVEATTSLEDLEKQCTAHTNSRLRLNAQLQHVHQQGLLAQKLLEQARAGADRQRLNAALEHLQAEAAARRALEQQLAALPAIATAAVARLRTLEGALRDARTRQDALATGVELLRGDRPVGINGALLAPGEERHLVDVFSLQVDEGVELRISPGGGQALEECRRSLFGAEEALAVALQELGVENVEAADRAARERDRLAQQLGARSAAAQPGDPSRLRAELERCEARLAGLADEIEAMAEARQAMEQEQPLPSDVEALEQVHRLLQQTWSATNSAFREAEAALQAAALRLEATRRAQADEAAARARLEAELGAKIERQRQLLTSHGNEVALSKAVDALTGRVTAAEGEIRELNAALQALQAGDVAAEITQLEQTLEQLEGQCRSLIGQQGAARQRCLAISSSDPHAEVEQARVAREAAEAHHNAIRRLTAAQQLLQQLFSDARADLSLRYTEPLARAIDSYLMPLVPQGPACCLSFDQSSGFTGLQLRRGSELYSFDVLSGGMREQLTAALRLAMADALKAAHDGCLPLVFDDAFTNSDPERVAVVRRMLDIAVERGLQVILLTCQAAAYADFKGRRIELSNTALG